MNFYFDENLPKQIAEALNILDKTNKIFSIKNINEGIKDIDLIPFIAKNNGILITNDRKMRKNKAEREALISNNLTVFFVQNLNYWSTVKMIINHWEQIVKKASATPKNKFYRITSRGGIKDL